MRETYGASCLMVGGGVSVGLLVVEFCERCRGTFVATVSDPWAFALPSELWLHDQNRAPARLLHHKDDYSLADYELLCCRSHMNSPQAQITKWLFFRGECLRDYLYLCCCFLSLSVDVSDSKSKSDDNLWIFNVTFCVIIYGGGGGGVIAFKYSLKKNTIQTESCSSHFLLIVLTGLWFYKWEQMWNSHFSNVNPSQTQHSAIIVMMEWKLSFYLEEKRK